MATLNELAPKTDGVNNQGRLAHVPSDLLPPAITGPIFDQAQEHSLVMKLGRQIPISYGETVIPHTVARPEVGQVGAGTSNEQREGGVKPLSGTAWSTKSISPIKLAAIVTASEEFARMNPQGLYTQLQGDLAYAIGRGIDAAVFHGLSPLTGGSLQGIDSDNVIANTPNTVNLVKGHLYDGLLDGYDLVNDDVRFEFNGWAVDPRFRSQMLRESVVTAFENPSAIVNLQGSQAVNLSTTQAQVLGLNAHFGRGVRGDLGACANSGIQVIGGDFNQLAYGFADQIRVKISDQATLSDGVNDPVNLWQTNQVAILIEVTFGWILGDNAGFVKYSNVGTTTYTVGVGAASAGTFVLDVNGKPTAAIAYNAAASAVKSAIVAVDDGITASDVTVTGSAPTWTVTVPGLLDGDDATSLTAGSLTVSAV